MTEKLLDKIIFIIICLFFLIIGAIGNFRSLNYPGVAFDYIDVQNKIIVTATDVNDSNIKVDDQLIKIDSISFEKKWELDFLIDKYQFGDQVEFLINRNGNEQVISIALTKRFRAYKRFMIYNLFILGTLFWVVGIFIYLNRPTVWYTRVFCSCCMAVVVGIMIVWPGSPVQGNFISFLSYSIIIAFWILLPLIPAFILYFCMIYPNKKQILIRYKKLPVQIFRPSIVFIILLVTTYLIAVSTKNLEYYRYFYHLYNYGFRTFFLLYLLLSIFSLIHSYFVFENREERYKVLWIIWGLFVGTFPYLFLWNLPQTLGYQPLIPNIMNYIFMLIIPVTFAFSIIKYQILDIDILFKRSIIYIFGTIFFLLFYYMFVNISKFKFSDSLMIYKIPLIIAGIIIILFFSPILSRKIFVIYKTYFKGDYNYRSVVKIFNKELAATHSQNEVVNLLIENINSTLAIKKVLLLTRNNLNNHFDIFASSGFAINEISTPTMDFPDKLITMIERFQVPLLKGRKIKSKIIAVPSFKVINYKLLLFPHYLSKLIWEFIFFQPIKEVSNLPDVNILNELEIELLIPVFAQNKLLGILLAGEKISKVKYTDEDLELLVHFSTETMMKLEHHKLQEEMTCARAEKEKLEELNRLKSEFVYHVSHELRTPLTSISWAIENLLDGIPEKPSPKIINYLNGVYENSQHLNRMIENLLDLTRIEAGKIEICLIKINLKDQINSTINLIKSKAEIKNIKIENFVKSDFWILADRDHLQAILINLIDNAIKYSADKKIIKVKAEQIKNNIRNEMIAIHIIDKGIGISVEKQKVIFGRFERVKEDKTIREKGLGLGLHIVNKLIEFQNGYISVESEVGKGSTFSVVLPKAKI